MRIENTDADAAPAITAVAALADDLRRRMYGFIRDVRRPVSRDEAAAAAGISRKLAAFHLDKLVDAGLLRARYEAVGGIRKVGRTPKVYEPTDDDIRVSIPARHPELLADILLDTVLTDNEDGHARERAMQVAARRGTELGTTARDQDRPERLDAERTLTVAEQTLAARGFEPVRATPTCLRLRNCPFHPLAGKAPELVCGINHAFLTGFLTGLDAPRVQAVLAPRPGHCCVELRAHTPTPTGAER
ncbi:transcriptional regulator [Rhodococcus sp. WS4]|nr:transcriptional regulator [Rhodococcus sp. WS4]